MESEFAELTKQYVADCAKLDAQFQKDATEEGLALAREYASELVKLSATYVKNVASLGEPPKPEHPIANVPPSAPEEQLKASVICIHKPSGK